VPPEAARRPEQPFPYPQVVLELRRDATSRGRSRSSISWTLNDVQFLIEKRLESRPHRFAQPVLVRSARGLARQ
jgi:hypothetical protein